MRNVWMGVGLVVLWALVGWADCTILPPYSSGGTTVTLQFCGNLTVSGGTCQQLASNIIQCSVPEGTMGTLDMKATRTANVSGTVTIAKTSLPSGWPDFKSVSKSGSGTVVAEAKYQFTVPAGSAGKRFELKFQATTTGVPTSHVITLTVILDVTALEPKVYGPFTGMTNDKGEFQVSIPVMPNTYVTGTLTECTVRPMARTAVTIYVGTGTITIGSTGFVWASQTLPPLAQKASDIAYVLISVPGYPQVRVTQFRFVVFGNTTFVDVGTISLPAGSCTQPPPPPPPGPITGKSDKDGKFSVSDGKGLTVSGRLTECTVKPLPEQTFTLTPLYTEGAISGFKFSTTGYPDTTVTKFVSWFQIGTISIYNVGDVCFKVPTPPDLQFSPSAICFAVAPEETDDKDLFGAYFTLPQRPPPQPATEGAAVKCKVGVNLEIRNPGGQLVQTAFTILLRIVGPDGRELKSQSIPISPGDSPRSVRWYIEGTTGKRVEPYLYRKWDALPQEWEVEWVGVLEWGGGALVFEVVIDPENRVQESDEVNNRLRWRCGEVHQLVGDPSFKAQSGVRCSRPDGSWVVAKDVTVEGQAAFQSVTHEPALLEGTFPRTDRTIAPPCPTYCPTGLRYEWDFGDGTPPKTGRVVTHRYVKPGQYTLKLTVTMAGEQKTVSRKVEYREDPPPVVTLEGPRRAFLSGITVTAPFTATVIPNGNKLERVAFILNGQVRHSQTFNTYEKVQCTWTFDLGQLEPFPKRNVLEAEATVRDVCGGELRVRSSPLELPAASVPNWLTALQPFAEDGDPISGKLVQDGKAVLYTETYAFPRWPLSEVPLLGIPVRIPLKVPIFGGDYGFSVKGQVKLSLPSDSGGSIKGDAARFSLDFGAFGWKFSAKGKADVDGALTIEPPVRLTSLVLKGKYEITLAKSLAAFEVFEPIRALAEPGSRSLVAEAIGWLADLGPKLSAMVHGVLDFNFTFSDNVQTGCPFGLACTGAAVVFGEGGIQLGLNVKVLRARAYGTVRLTVRLAEPSKTTTSSRSCPDFESIKGSIVLGLEVGINLLFYRWKDKWEWEIPFWSSSPTQGFAVLDETGWVLENRSYATPTFYTFRGRLTAFPDRRTTELLLVEEVLPDAAPALVRDDGLILLLWATDDLAKPVSLGLEIVSSSGSTLSRMGRPRPLTDDLLPDGQPIIAFDSTGSPVAVWVRHIAPPQDLPRDIANVSPDLMKGVEIFYARYDRTRGTWDSPVRLTHNDFVDHSPSFLIGPWGMEGIVWVANTHGKLFPDRVAPNTIYVSFWDGKAFGAPMVLREGDVSLVRAFVSIGGRRILHVWPEDLDGDWKTVGDEELLWSVWDGISWSSPQRLTANGADDQWPVLFATGAGRADLFWTRVEETEAGPSGVILARSYGPTGWSQERRVLDDRSIFTFQAAQALDGKVALVWSALSDQGVDLFATVWDPALGRTSEVKQITFDRHHEDQVAAVFDGDLLTVAFVKTVADEQTKKVRYSGPDIEDPKVFHKDKEVDINVPVLGPSHLFLLEVRMP